MLGTFVTYVSGLDNGERGGEGVSQSPLKGRAFSIFLDQNPPFELRRQQKQHVNNNLYHIHIRHFACCRRSVLPPRPFALTDDKIVLGELEAIRLAGKRQTRHSVCRVGW
jgi:hypothetical protein